VDFARQLAEVLRRTREEAALTHRQMAKRLGVSHATYTRLENANQNVTLKTLAQLCRALDCDMGALFRGGVRLRRRPTQPP
jgi:transcriptional regulator with XRE-family HTH domain